jgi:hypothetical protein
LNGVSVALRIDDPDRFWNRIPDDIRERIMQLALDEPALSPRELAVRFTDTEKYFAAFGRARPVQCRSAKLMRGARAKNEF